MTPDRAKEILAAASAYPRSGPWMDAIDSQLRPGEAEQVKAYWETLPDNTSFVDALSRIAAGVQEKP